IVSPCIPTKTPARGLRLVRSIIAALAILAIFVSFGSICTYAQCGNLGAPSTRWQNAGNSFWNLDGNWTSGTPTASTNACILNGTSTVTLDSAGNAKGLQLASGNTLNMEGGASLSLGSGTSLIYGMLSNIGGTITNSGMLTNGGSIFVDGGPMPGQAAALINNS